MTSYGICLSPSDFLSMIIPRSISVAANGIMSFSLFGHAMAPKACGILVSQLGAEPGPLTVKAPSPTYWTTSKFLHFSFFFFYVLAALGLHCCSWAFCGCSKRRLLYSCSVGASDCSGFSCCRAQVSGCMSFSSCGVKAR